MMIERLGKICFVSGEIIFNFTYDSPQNAYGKLESINYRNGKSLILKYDYAMRINDIVQMPSGNKLKVNGENLVCLLTNFGKFRSIFLNKNSSLIWWIIMMFPRNFSMIMDY